MTFSVALRAIAGRFGGDAGQTMGEYSLVLGGVALVVAVVLATLGGQIGLPFEAVVAEFTGG